jgi:ribosomal protein S27AE
MAEKKVRTKVVKIIVERNITLQQKICPQCGKSFMGAKVARYCSTACRNKAAYWRRPEAYREIRMESYRRKKKQMTKKKESEIIRYLSER